MLSSTKFLLFLLLLTAACSSPNLKSQLNSDNELTELEKDVLAKKVPKQLIDPDHLRNSRY
ncbi:hypothetical protein N9N67_05255 [Bacteriovoracaceae bacterium]|nr:hypothetical protein [Bacteriovoracaceae bacterium]